eukprot:GHRQ01030196.1.p2 GENE.GHRQ01030196.1~~GHRQ01030196.1.p2  ORF type:complete len:119 (+),score=34.90 GHRQ01030196.1:178-534(+)
MQQCLCCCKMEAQRVRLACAGQGRVMTLPSRFGAVVGTCTASGMFSPNSSDAKAQHPAAALKFIPSTCSVLLLLPAMLPQPAQSFAARLKRGLVSGGKQQLLEVQRQAAAMMTMVYQQ